MEILSGIGDITIVGEIITTAVIAFYFVYAFLVWKQTRMLNEGFSTDSEKFLNTVALIHLFAAFILLAIGVIIVLI